MIENIWGGPCVLLAQVIDNKDLTGMRVTLTVMNSSFTRPNGDDISDDKLIKIQRKCPTKSTSLQGQVKFVFPLKRSEPH